LSRLVILYYGLPLKLAGLLGRGKLSLLKLMAKTIGNHTGSYCLLDFLPRTAEQVSLSVLPTDTEENEFAIVIQGPISEGFTPETVRIYKRLFPKAALIVSTWDDTDAVQLEDIEENAVLLLNRMPEVVGMHNINCQCLSSRAGIREAQRIGARYVLKTRTDQRIYAPYALEYLKSLLEVFPLDGSARQWQKERIITLNGPIDTAYAPYWIQDFFYFGTILW